MDFGTWLSPKSVDGDASHNASALLIGYMRVSLQNTGGRCPGETVIVKKFLSAFEQTELDAELKPPL
jgi:hypothetical protein